ncbi:MAG: hypothetical protein HY290_23290 [Planctomycetia bacterium]|nr:hypothetical protein [Planctomycetia bacterium]
MTQLGLQFGGIFAFRSPDVVDELKLTSDQRKAIRKIERDWQPGPRRREAGGERSTAPPRPTREELVARVLRILNEEQVRKWTEMTGPQFTDFQERPFRGAPDRGPPPGERRRPKEPRPEQADGDKPDA